MSISTVQNQRPIAECAAHLADVVNEICESQHPIVLTDDEKPKAVLVDWETYKKHHETIRLAFLLGEGHADVRAGRTQPLSEVIRELENDGAF